jgi:hypothetical protein
MGMAAFRKLVSCVLLLIFPGSLIAADSGAAMLYTDGAWLNGSRVPQSSAIFSGDLLQTRPDSAANIHAPGSSVTILGDSLVQFEGAFLRVEHGGVSVSTSKGLATTAGDVRVAPASTASWTEFNVTDTDGTVRIAARKGDLSVTDADGKVMLLAQGQDKTLDEQSDQTDQSNNGKKKKNKKEVAGAAPAAGGGLLNSPIAVGIGGAAIVGVTVWVLLQSSAPLSPASPNE